MYDWLLHYPHRVLIGWIGQQRKYCFKWSRKYPLSSIKWMSSSPVELNGMVRFGLTSQRSPDLKCTFIVGGDAYEWRTTSHQTTLPLNMLNVTNSTHNVKTDAIKFFYRFLQTLEVSIVQFVIVSLHVWKRKSWQLNLSSRTFACVH